MADFIHAKCLATTKDGSGFTLICRRSKGHDRSEDPKRREHFDSSADEYWTEEG